MDLFVCIERLLNFFVIIAEILHKFELIVPDFTGQIKDMFFRRESGHKKEGPEM